MEYEKFINTVREKIQERLGGECIVEIKETLKNNSSRFIGIHIRKSGNTAAPLIYLEQQYREYLEGETFENIIQKIIKVYENAVGKELLLDEESITFEKCQKQIFYKLISQKENEELLWEVPYIPFLDLAIVFAILFKQDEDGVESMRINHEIKKHWGISVKELLTCASRNTREIFPPRLIKLEDLILDNFSKRETLQYDEISIDMPSFLVLTNRTGINGATTILYPGELKEIARKAGGDLYILPSSIHEVLIVPCSKDYNLQELSKLVQNVNRTQVSQEEILSNFAYRYHYETDSFEMDE